MAKDSANDDKVREVLAEMKAIARANEAEIRRLRQKLPPRLRRVSVTRLVTDFLKSEGRKPAG